MTSLVVFCIAWMPRLCTVPSISCHLHLSPMRSLQKLWAGFSPGPLSFPFLVLPFGNDFLLISLVSSSHGAIWMLYVIVSALGSLLGCFIGWVSVIGVSHIPLRVRGILYADYFPVASNWHHYLWAIVIAAIAVAIASWVPAYRAAQLQPVSTLRGSSI